MVAFIAPRMWILSLLFSLTGSAANLFFSLRYPSVAITPIIALVLVHPLGKFWDVLLKRMGDPLEVFENGTLHHREPLSGEIDAPKIPWTSSVRLWFAQGRWNEKEHACVYISSNVSFGFAFATDVSTDQAYFHFAYLTNSTGNRGTAQILPAGGPYNVPTTAHHLHPSPGLCLCWSHQTVSCAPISYDLAGNAHVDCNVFHNAQDHQQESQWMEHLPIQVFHSCMGRCFRLVLHPGFADACT